MLTEAQIRIIKATVPLLESGGETLTTHFYGIMLREYPQVRPLFNVAHQASGTQPRALAGGVLAYARHIDQLNALGPLVARIVHKHAALQVLPEHYPIVGTCLLRAMREVLGPEIATDEVIDAWAAAYGQLAELLIGAEEQVYAENESKAGGWRGARPFWVARKVPESEEITSFYLEPVDGGAVAEFVPGQYIGLRLVLDGEEVRRNYSLSAAPNGKSYRISVKREPGGRVSNHLHDQVHEHDVLELFAPAGDFVLTGSDRPLVLIGAGVGVTPTLAMLEASLPSKRPVHVIHCARHAGVHGFRDWLNDLTAEHPQVKGFVCYSEPREGDIADGTGLLTENHLRQWLPDTRDVDAYFVGPKPFMALVKKLLLGLGVPETQARYEFFGPAEALES